jgi:hypothetical protein
MPLQADLTQHSAGCASNEFGETTLHAISQQLLAGLGSPEVFLQFRQGDAGTGAPFNRRNAVIKSSPFIPGIE